MTTHYDLIVIGEGIAGLTCAQEAAKLGLKVATFEAEFFGGLVVNVNELQRFDEAKGLSGMDHAAIMAKSNATAGVKSTNAAVTAIRRKGDAFEVETDGGAQAARAVVIASGARLKKLGVAGEDEFDGCGVSHCADCDAPLYTDAKVVVAGGNDWAIHEATVLAQEAAKVYLVHDGAALQASSASIEHLKSESKIEVVPDAAIDAILGDASGVTGVRLRGASGVREIECTGVFPFIGLIPDAGIAPAEVPRDDNGALQVNGECETAVPNLFAIGNVRSGFGGWLVDAAADARSVARTIKSRLG